MDDETVKESLSFSDVVNRGWDNDGPMTVKVNVEPAVHFYEIRLARKQDMRKLSLYLTRVIGENKFKYSRVVSSDESDAYIYAYEVCLTLGEYQQLWSYLCANQIKYRAIRDVSNLGVVDPGDES